MLHACKAIAALLAYWIGLVDCTGRSALPLAFPPCCTRVVASLQALVPAEASIHFFYPIEMLTIDHSSPRCSGAIRYGGSPASWTSPSLGSNYLLRSIR